jgi:hypothetical protein
MENRNQIMNVSYEAPVVEELGTLESMIQVTGAGTNADGELFNS